MKKLLGILVLGLFLITPSQADDIRDFQIEGMSIGDSLLDYFSEEEIKKNALNSLAPNLVYEEGDIIKRTIRDIYDEQTKSIVIEGNEAYQKAKKFMRQITPKNVKYIKKYRGSVPLFYKEGIEKKLNQIFNK